MGFGILPVIRRANTKIDTEVKARVYFDIHNQALLERIRRGENPQEYAGVPDDEISMRLQAMEAQGLIERTDTAEGTLRSLCDAIETDDEVVNRIFQEYQLDLNDHVNALARRLLAQGPTHFFANVDAQLHLSQDELMKLRLAIIELVAKAATQNDHARYPCTHFHVGFTPYTE